MPTRLAVILTLIVSGCASAPEVDTRAAVKRIQAVATPHAAALAGDDVVEMRRTGRNLIATIDAAIAPL